MNDLTPPPGRRLPDDARARIRARLVEAAGEQPGTGRRWLLPIAAAAAVLVISAGTGYVALRPSADSGPSPAPAPAASTTAPTAVPSPTPSESPSAAPEDIPPPTAEPPTPNPTALPTCGAAVDEQLNGSIEQVVSWNLPDGTAGIWVAGERAVLCEDSGGIATAHWAAAVDAGPMTSERLAWSTSTYGVGRVYDTAFVAGGILPEGVTGIDYLWPDGHTEAARIADEGGHQWWLVAYVPEDGMLVETGTNFMKFDDVHVTVSWSGAQTTFDLPFATNMCAQVNHGC